MLIEDAYLRIGPCLVGVILSTFENIIGLIVFIFFFFAVIIFIIVCLLRAKDYTLGLCWQHIWTCDAY